MTGPARGASVAVTVAPSGTVALAWREGGGVAHRRVADVEAPTAIAELERETRPRWTVWSPTTLAAMLRVGVRPATAWDVAAVHRLLVGGWRADPVRAFAAVHGLDFDRPPTEPEADLFTHLLVDAAAAADAVREDGHLNPSWTTGVWYRSPERMQRWTELLLETAERQQERLGAGPHATRLLLTARAESGAEILCAELAADGLPIDVDAMEQLLAEAIGPRPASEADAIRLRAARDVEVLDLAPGGLGVDLRSPEQVKRLLKSVGVDLPDTRAWRLEAAVDEHPVVAALLRWRKAERIATTYGYGWLDRYVGADGRLRGDWTGCDGAAGRMTASAGLHNMPADLRSAVRAEPGHVLVRADLGQIEPRVLAAVSGDVALAAAAAQPDMYSPVAARLGVDRPTAKVAMLGAMYGQTTGHGAVALRQLHANYPIAMEYLDTADRDGQAGRDIRTYGGRLVRMTPGDESELDDRDARSRAAARGRYGRNAIVQGAAAEFFKQWAVTVRARGAALGAQIVLCLHDELLLQVPTELGAAAAEMLDACLAEAAGRWAPGSSVQFVADTAVVERWSDAKG